MQTEFELLTLGCAWLVATAFRPWQTLRRPELAHPWLAALVIGPWAWTNRMVLPGGIALHLSGACLLVLMFGWPLAIWTLTGIALLHMALAYALFPHPQAWEALWQPSLHELMWSGIMPASLGLMLGLLSRRCLPHHLFVYILVRAFFVTMLAMLGSAFLQISWFGHPAQIRLAELLIGRWLMGWGEGVATGMLVAIFVAYQPLWLITYSDARYLPKDGP